MSDVTIPQPTRPWQRKRSEVARSGVSFGIVGLLSFGIVLFTGFAGVDGWAVCIMLLSVAALIYRGRKLSKKERGNATVRLVITAAAVLAFAPWLSILGSVLFKGVVGLRLNFITSDMRTTVPDDELNMGGALHAVLGSLLMVLIATIITLPLGILSGVYLTEIKGRFTFLVRFVVQSMSGVPSIVAGLFIYAVWMIALGNQYSAGAGAMALAILMIPTVARTSEEVLKLIPQDLREAGTALGGTQWRTVAMIVIPAARSGLITAVILGVARVAGETAPLLLTMGGADAINLNPFNGNSSALPFYIWKNFSLGTETAVARAWTGILVLMIVVLFFFSITRIVGNRKVRS